MVFTGLEIILAVFHIGMTLLVGYLLFLTMVAQKWNAVRMPGRSEPSTHFLILIPAHNEEALLPVLLRSLQDQKYPHHLFSIYVVADNCTDQTALVAENGGAKVLTRFNDFQKGKGYALQWGFQQIEDSEERFDSVIVLDADSTVSGNFLQVMDRYMNNGDSAVQAYYAVQNPGESWAGGIRQAALTGVHFLRPLAREALKFSVGLKGNGMAFRPSLLRKNAWSGSITEDIDLHMAIVLQGERVAFAPEAVVWGEMPNSLANSRSQHARWERGRLQMAKKYIPRLLSNARTAILQKRFHRGFLMIDAAMEHLIPPISILLATIILFLLMDALALIGYYTSHRSGDTAVHPWVVINIVFGLGLLIAMSYYIFTGLRLAKTPKSVYRSLMMVPRYLVWKVGEYAGISLKHEQGDEVWVRTARNKGELNEHNGVSH